MTFYRVADWNKHFENNRTRELKRMDWVPVPNKHDGDGFTELLDHPNGMAHYGAWHLILQVASKCTPRGTLIRDVTIPQEGAGRCRTPHTADSLSRITHGPKIVFLEAIPRLINIGWLEACEESRQNPAPACGKVPEALTGTERNGTEENGRECGARAESSIIEFDSFWTAYPRKVGRFEAERAWVEVRAFEFATEIMAAVEEQSESQQWKEDNGRFIPSPANWLRDGRWNDKPTDVKKSPYDGFVP